MNEPTTIREALEELVKDPMVLAAAMVDIVAELEVLRTVSHARMFHPWYDYEITENGRKDGMESPPDGEEWNCCTWHLIPGNRSVYMDRGDFSETWYSVFADSIPTAHTEMEIAFLTRHLPQPAYQRILDVCCGHGRHAVRFAEAGYDVLAIDNNPMTITRAQADDGPCDRIRHFGAGVHEHRRSRSRHEPRLERE